MNLDMRNQPPMMKEKNLTRDVRIQVYKNRIKAYDRRISELESKKRELTIEIQKLETYKNRVSDKYD
jgi:hypothetical protein